MVSQGNWTLCSTGGTRQLFTAPSASIFHSLSTRLAPPSTHTQPLLLSHPFPTFKADFGHFGKVIVRLCGTLFHTSSPFLHHQGKGVPNSLSRARCSCSPDSRHVALLGAAAIRVNDNTLLTLLLHFHVIRK